MQQGHAQVHDTSQSINQSIRRLFRFKPNSYRDKVGRSFRKSAFVIGSITPLQSVLLSYVTGQHLARFSCDVSVRIRIGNCARNTVQRYDTGLYTTTAPKVLYSYNVNRARIGRCNINVCAVRYTDIKTLIVRIPDVSVGQLGTVYRISLTLFPH